VSCTSVSVWLRWVRPPVGGDHGGGALPLGTLTPVEVITDKAAVYPRVLEELAPGAWHHTELYVNNRIEADHGQLKRRLRSMR
jgi:DDE domain